MGGRRSARCGCRAPGGRIQEALTRTVHVLAGNAFSPAKAGDRSLRQPRGALSALRQRNDALDSVRVRQELGVLVGIGLVTDNPAADVKKPRGAKKSVYILEPEEIARLRAALDVPWERFLIELTITTGLRSGEVRGLVWDSIALEGERLFVEHQATRR